MAMKQTDVSKHQRLISNTPTCPRATGGEQGREGGPVIFSPTLLPGKLNLLMRLAAATCLLQLARQLSTHPRSMQSLSINQSSSYLHSSRACLLGLQTFNQCIAARLQRKHKRGKSFAEKRTASSALVMHAWKDILVKCFTTFLNTPCRTAQPQYLFYTFCGWLQSTTAMEVCPYNAKYERPKIAK